MKKKKCRNPDCAYYGKWRTGFCPRDRSYFHRWESRPHSDMVKHQETMRRRQWSLSWAMKHPKRKPHEIAKVISIKPSLVKLGSRHIVTVRTKLDA